MRIRLAVPALGFAALATVAACDGDRTLGVVNENQPDIDRALSTAAGIEQLIGDTYKQHFQQLYGSSDAIWPQTLVYSLESYAAVANFGMALRVAIPRFPIANERGNQVQVGNVRDFSGAQRVARTAANGVRALDNLIAGGGSTGSAGRDARNRAFAFFVNGVALGQTAHIYDSLALVTPAVASDVVPPLSSAAEGVATALALLDSALAIGGASSAAAGFPTPATWINGNALSQAQFVALVRTYKAKIRANVARTPAERAAVDWAAVIADANAGITSDFNITLSPADGWNSAFTRQMHNEGGWHQMTMLYYGMADTSGGYANYISQPLAQQNGYFLVRTPDRRWPSGDTRAAQQANSPDVLPTGQYVRNRSITDSPADAWGVSFYDHKRFRPIFAGNGNGPWPIITKAEVDLLAAEGYFRTSQFAQAAEKIDIYRVRSGLPSLVAAGVTNATSPVPGGSACVPRVPQPPSFNTVACGTLFEALKYEKRLETAFTGYAQWFLDGRGWGDLVQGTPTGWPVPYQELDARAFTIYGITDVAGAGTYGF